MAAEIGSLAPDFILPNQDRQPVTLSAQLRDGPVILAFVPGAFSDTCTKEICTFRDTLGSLAGVSPRLLVVSVDSFFALRAWADLEHFEFPLLSDFNKVVIHQYGVFNEDMIGLKGLAKRAVFVIDRAGTVRYREVLDDARNEPDYARTRDVFASLVA